MRPSLIAWLMMSLLASRATEAAREQLSNELDEYSSAGSEDIYLQSNSGQDSDDEVSEEGEDEEEEEEEEQQQLPQLGNNIEAIGLNEINCEFSCPRYYRPVCVSRNDQLITFATPCEFLNRLRCSNVARRRGEDTPTYQLLYNTACKQDTR